MWGGAAEERLTCAKYVTTLISMGRARNQNTTAVGYAPAFRHAPSPLPLTAAHISPLDMKGPMSSSRFGAILEVIAQEVEGKYLPGLSESSSGHAAGAPWQKLFGEVLGRYFEEQTFTQNDYLNQLFAANQQATTLAARKALIGGPARLQLLGLSDDSIKQWRPDRQFGEDRQDATADFVVANGLRPFIDVKSRNLKKRSRPGNMISGLKVAEACKLLLESDSGDLPDLFYVRIDWEVEGEGGVCRSVTVRNFMRTPPKEFYINFDAGQIQCPKFEQLSQSFAGDSKAWAVAFQEHYANGLREHISKLQERVNYFSAPSAAPPSAAPPSAAPPSAVVPAEGAQESGAVSEVAAVAVPAAKVSAPADAAVSLGSTVIKLRSSVACVDEEGVQQTFELVPPLEADVKAGKLSSESPVARALAGRRSGEVVSIRTPGGERRLRIISVEGPEA